MEETGLFGGQKKGGRVSFRVKDRLGRDMQAGIALRCKEESVIFIVGPCVEDRRRPVTMLICETCSGWTVAKLMAGS
jgi:hypothetical protein